MKKIIVSLLLLAFFISSIILPVSASDDYWSKKIDNNIYKLPKNEYDKRLIYITRNGIDAEIIENEFKVKYGYSTQKYENEAIYKMITEPEVISKVNEKYGSVYAKSEYFGEKLYNDNTTIQKQVLLEDYYQFTNNKRKTIRDLHNEDIKNFAQKYRINLDDITYEGIYTGSIIMYATDFEIETLAKDSSVEKIYPFLEMEAVTDMSTSPILIQTDNNTGTKSSNYNNGSGYKGSGVKIGIIEEEGGKYDSNNIQLEDIHDLTLYYVENEMATGEPSDHATVVTSIIVGQPYTFNGKTYEGVVPNATVYQTTANGVISAYNALNILISEGVSVVNFSASYKDAQTINGVQYTPNKQYSIIDLEFDKITYSTGVVLVNTPGNAIQDENDIDGDGDVNEIIDESIVYSPGKAYNAITVGNVNATVSNDNRYSMYFTTSYNEMYYLSNKPDVSAPGTNIYVVYNDAYLIRATGTSSSAPMVTGVVAQLHQASPTLISNPTKTKALILAGADPTVISPEYNSGVNPNGFIREKSGLGMLNAVNSVNAALEGNFGSTTFNLRGTSSNMHTYSGDAVQVGKQYLRAGEKIRVVLTFDKPEHWLLVDENYNNNVDLYLYGPNGNMVLSSVTPVDSTGAPDVVNNVEVLEFTATTAGEYKIKAKLVTFNGAPGITTMNVAAVWTTTHNHIYNVSYEQRPSYPAHYAYCICGDYIEENHTFISGPVGTYCQKCYYISSYN